MARPPIIISNGGVLDLLSRGLVEEKNSTREQKEHAKDRIRENVKKLIQEGREETKIVIIKSTKSDAPCLFWYKSDENTNYINQLKKYGLNSNQFDGEEGVSINEIVDDTI